LNPRLSLAPHGFQLPGCHFAVIPVNALLFRRESDDKLTGYVYSCLLYFLTGTSHAVGVKDNLTFGLDFGRLAPHFDV
jgi:hypothetical protein